MRLLAYSKHLLPTIFLALAVLSSPGLVRGADGDVVVRVMPFEGSYRQGEEITVEVWVENVAQLYGADISLRFDPTRFSVLDADPIRPGVQITPSSSLLSPDMVIRREADNGSGQVWYAVTQLNPSAPVSGSGMLFSFRLQMKLAGLDVVRVESQQLATRDGDLIQANTRDARYWISVNGESPKIAIFSLVPVGH